MNRKLLKIVGIVLCTFALIANLQYALLNYGLKDNGLGQQLYAQNGSGGDDTADDNGGGGMGCYTYGTILCPNGSVVINGVCNFTGIYGEPTTCREMDCYFNDRPRRCVKRV